MRVFKTILISILICLTLFGTVAAINIDVPVYASETESGEIQPRVEETCWYYKNVDGVLYMRLWSITYGKWLTDWIIV